MQKPAGISRRGFLGALSAVPSLSTIHAADPKTNSRPATARPATPQIANLNELLEPVRANGKVPALTAAAIVDGKLAGVGAVGIRKGGMPIAVKGTDLWHIGSCTKAMTATLIALFVERRKMQWDMTIWETLPELRETMHASYRDVTLAQLLNHRTGIPAQPDTKTWDEAWTQRGTATEQRLSFVKNVLAKEPEAGPGTKYIYSNQNYAIAGAMLERVGNDSWENLMREQLFRPLNMTMSGFGVPGTIGQIDQPWGHKWKNGKLEPIQQDNPPAIGPGGTVHSSIWDFSRFVLLHLRGARGEAGMLKAETFERLHTPPAGQDYAMGWLRQDRGWARGWTLTHAGSNTLNYAVIWIAPLIKFAGVAVTNIGGDSGSNTCDDAIQAMIKKYVKA